MVTLGSTQSLPQRSMGEAQIIPVQLPPEHV